MYEIVANKKSSIDVDKFDYIHRDSYYLNLMGDGFDTTRLISNSRVMGNEICYNLKIYNELRNVF